MQKFQPLLRNVFSQQLTLPFIKFYFKHLCVKQHVKKTTVFVRILDDT